MKSWILLTVLTIGITAVITVAGTFFSTETPNGPEFPAPPKPDGPAPKLVIDGNLTYNFGTLGQKTPGTHPWTFTNAGQGVLEVRGSSTTCSCTTSALFEGAEMKTGKLITIQPGESKQISVNWNTKQFENHYRQAITAGTNDPDRPTVELAVEGTIKLALVTVPSDSAVSFMNISNDEPVLRRVLVASPDRPDTKITGSVISNPSLLSVEVRDLSPEENKNYKFEKAHWIDITLKPTPNLGEFNEEIVVETDHPMRKSLTIKVKGKVTGPISIIPEKVDIRDATSSNGGTQTLTIWARARTSVNFTIDKKPAGMDVEIESQPASPGMKGSKYKMIVKLAPGLEAGPIDGEIVLKTDEPKASEIRIPVAVLIKGTL
jgi:Protein of unknown function (DUF1573)